MAHQTPLLFPHALAFFLQRIQLVRVQVLTFKFTEQAMATTRGKLLYGLARRERLSGNLDIRSNFASGHRNVSQPVLGFRQLGERGRVHNHF